MLKNNSDKPLFYNPAIYTLIIVIVLLFALMAILRFSWRVSSEDSIARMVPVTAQVYLHLDHHPYQLADKKALPVFNEIFTQIDRSFFNDPDIKLLDDVEKYLDREIALILDKQDNLILIAKVKKSRELIPRLRGKENFSLLTGGYLVVSKNPKALTVINEAKTGTQKSILEKIPWQDEHDQNIIKAYLDPSHISTLINNQQIKQLWEKYLTNNDLQYIYLAANENLNFSIKTNALFGDADPLLFNDLPKNTILTVATDDLLSTTQNISKYLINDDSQIYSQLLSLWQSYEENYLFSFWEIANLLDRPGQLLIAKENNQLKYSLIVKTNLEDEKIVENILKNIIARHFPEKIEKELPDGTTVQELVSQPENFHLDEVEINGQTVKVVKNSQPVWELAYTTDNKFLYLGNSIDLVSKLVAKDNKISLTDECPIISSPNLFVRLPELTKNDKLSIFSQMFNKLALNITDQTIFGCTF